MVETRSKLRLTDTRDPVQISLYSATRADAHVQRMHVQSFWLGNAFAIQSRRNPLLAYEVLQTPVGNRAIISYHVVIHATANGSRSKHRFN